MDKISTCLWFDSEAEAAVNFYTSIFKNSKKGRTTYYTEPSPSNKPVGSVLTVEFTIEGRDFLALNGGPMFKHSEAVSFMVNCKDQKEIDYYWDKLLAGGGEASHCGWLKDKYGISWQVTPASWADMMQKNPAKYMAAMMQMVKFDLKKLEEAANS